MKISEEQASLLFYKGLTIWVYDDEISRVSHFDKERLKPVPILWRINEVTDGIQVSSWEGLLNQYKDTNITHFEVTTTSPHSRVN